MTKEEKGEYGEASAYCAYLAPGIAGSYARSLGDISEEDFLAALAAEMADMPFIPLLHVKPSMPFNHRDNTEMFKKARNLIRAELLKKYEDLDEAGKKRFAKTVEKIKQVSGRF